MKLHKINKEGTIAVVIPKDLAQILGWKSGQDVVVNSTEDNSVIKLINTSLRKEK